MLRLSRICDPWTRWVTGPQASASFGQPSTTAATNPTSSSTGKDRTMRDASSQAGIAELAAALYAYVDHQRELGMIGFPRMPAAGGAPAPPTPTRAGHLGASPAMTADLFTAPGLA